MPAIVSGEYSDNNIFYMSYLSTYLDRDIKELSETIDSLKFMRFITAVAARCSQLVNYSSIAQDAEINEVTAKDWLRYIRNTRNYILFASIFKQYIKTYY